MNNTITDKEIVELYLAREEKASIYCTQKYSASLYRLASSLLLDSRDAEECVNDTFLKAWESEEPYKKFGMIKKSYGMIIITAAILVFAVPVGAFTIRYFLHRDNVEHYISGADEVSGKNPDIVNNLVAENDDYRLTLDAVFSDGHNAMIIITSEAISEKGRKHFDKTGYGYFMPSFCIKYADGSDGPSHYSANQDIDFPIIGTGYAYEYVEEAEARDDVTSAFVVDCSDIDLGKDVKLELFANERPLLCRRYFDSRDPVVAKRFPDEAAADIINYLEGMEFTVHFAPNVTCDALYDADGRQVFMSAFELYSNDPSVIPGLCDITFLKDSGERIRFEMKDGRVHAQDNTCLVFSEFIDPNEYAGVEINGVEFWKCLK